MHAATAGTFRRAFALAACTLACGLAAADYPDRSIKFLVPWPAGGATDQVARILSQPLAQAMGVAVIVENNEGRAVAAHG